MIWRLVIRSIFSHADVHLKQRTGLCLRLGVGPTNGESTLMACLQRTTAHDVGSRGMTRPVRITNVANILQLAPVAFVACSPVLDLACGSTWTIGLSTATSMLCRSTG